MKRLFLFFLFMFMIINITASSTWVNSPTFSMDNVDPVVTLISPDGDENLSATNITNITWNALDGNLTENSIDLEYSSNNGQDYSIISSASSNDGIFPWIIPNLSTTDALLRVIAIDSFGNRGEDVSNSSFNINAFPGVNNIFPANGSENMPSIVNVSWYYENYDITPQGFYVYQGGDLVATVPYTSNATIYSALLNSATFGSTVNWEVVPYNNYAFCEEAISASFTVVPEHLAGTPTYILFSQLLSVAEVNPPLITLSPIDIGRVITPTVEFTFDSIPAEFTLSVEVSDQPSHLLPEPEICYASLRTNLPNGIPTTITFDFEGQFVPVELVRWNGSSWEDITDIASVEFSEGKVSFTWTSSVRGDEEFAVNSNSESTLPVQFSGFTASQTNSGFVSLSWITHSESSLLGYNVYRNDTNNLNNSLRITPIMINAINSALGGSYSLEDREVELNNSYNYWVQAVEINGNITYHGPIKVFLNGEITIEAPRMTTLYSAYPNPFNPTTTIKFNVKENDKATLIIANIKGQIVKSYPAYNTGEHTIIWDGNDNQGNKVSSGFYFYKLKSDTTQQIRKMLLLK